MKYKKSVPKGYRAYWHYNGLWKEIKTKKGNWKISFRSYKNRKSKKYGSHPKGRRIRWKINAIQDVLKTDKGQYITHMYGTKKYLKSGYKKLKK